MQLKTLILLLETHINIDSLANNARLFGIHLVCDISFEEFAASSYPRETTFLITDNKDICDALNELEYGYSAYMSSKNEEASFPGALYLIESIDDIEMYQYNRMLLRFLDIPWVITETNRLIIREMSEADLNALYEIYSDPDAVRYTEPLPEDREKELEYISSYKKYMYRFFEYGMWLVVLKENGEVIGRVGLSIRDNYDIPELGYIIKREFRNKGYAFESLNAVVNYVREELQLDSLAAFIHPDNTASVLLIRKLGFKDIGIQVFEGVSYLAFLWQ